MAPCCITDLIDDETSALVSWLFLDNNRILTLQWVFIFAYCYLISFVEHLSNIFSTLPLYAVCYQMTIFLFKFGNNTGLLIYLFGYLYVCFQNLKNDSAEHLVTVQSLVAELASSLKKKVTGSLGHKYVSLDCRTASKWLLVCTWCRMSFFWS